MADEKNTIIGSGDALKLSFTKEGKPIVNGEELVGVVISAPTTTYEKDGLTIEVSPFRVAFKAQPGSPIRNIPIELDGEGYANLNAWAKPTNNTISFEGFGPNDNGRKIQLLVDATTLKPNAMEITEDFKLKLDDKDNVALKVGGGLNVTFSHRSTNHGISIYFDQALGKAAVLKGAHELIREKLDAEVKIAATTALCETKSFTSQQLPACQVAPRTGPEVGR